jgi:redox-sensitive bicupin YhaK (pirin superfamily)
MNTQTADTPYLRKLGRRRPLGAPEPGFAGPGHTAIEVVTSEALAASDPFVLLMDDRLDFAAGQQIGGPHPHAGLETVTLLLEGSLIDRDEGSLYGGDALWMTAGRGVVHNEYVRTTGAARLLQLWVTLPEKKRAAAPRFDVLRRDEMPVHRAPGVEARLYSGRTNGLSSSTKNHVPVTLVDVRLQPGAVFEQELPAGYNGFLYPIAGAIRVAESEPLRTGNVGWLEPSDAHARTVLRLISGREGARVILYAGQRQNEATVHYGPFVAGSTEAIARMYRDYREGRFTRISELARSRAVSA